MIDQHPFMYCHDPMRSFLVCHGMMSVAQPGLDRDAAARPERASEPSAPDGPRQMAPSVGNNEATSQPEGWGKSGENPTFFPTPCWDVWGNVSPTGVSSCACSPLPPAWLKMPVFYRRRCFDPIESPHSLPRWLAAPLPMHLAPEIARVSQLHRSSQP